MRGTMMERFMAKVAVNPYGCWLWTACLNTNGYGHFTAGYRPDGKAEQWLAHRLMYTIARGPIPDGLVLDHLCRTPRCVNPWHLEPVTNAENHHRRPPKLFCPHGHIFTEANTAIYPGRRNCRACMRAQYWQRKAREQTAAQAA